MVNIVRTLLTGGKSVILVSLRFKFTLKRRLSNILFYRKLPILNLKFSYTNLHHSIENTMLCLHCVRLPSGTYLEEKELKDRISCHFFQLKKVNQMWTGGILG